jgi:hypothetical protein
MPMKDQHNFEHFDERSVPMTPKHVERVVDEEIQPLLDQIASIATEQGIPFLFVCSMARLPNEDGPDDPTEEIFFGVFNDTPEIPHSPVVARLADALGSRGR